jgi:hypothetical protein
MNTDILIISDDLDDYSDNFPTDEMNASQSNKINIF